jgi:hypothetical protein
MRSNHHPGAVRGPGAAAWACAAALSLAPAALAGDNPPARGFDAAGSDPRAIEIADRTMEAMGGRAAWDAVRVIRWTIFKRAHAWDKWTGDYRLEADTTLVVMNLNTKEGRVWEKGVEVSDPEKRAEILADAYSIWINDSYWLVMPYKLKDTGVTLRYAGEKPSDDGRSADVLQLTFHDVGDTPENRYLVWVDRETGLVSQWSYFKNAADPEPKFTLPWNGWESFGPIKLASGRGRTEVTGIRVSVDAVPSAFAAP